VTRLLSRIADRLARPVHFVLGNHDFYRGSILEVRSAVATLASGDERLRWLSGFRLRVRFEDGLQGEVWMRRLLEGEVEGTVFEALRDPSNFADVHIELGAVTWQTGADLAPDAMYDEIRAKGVWDVEP
jgi:hypothetical protein